MAMLIVLGTSSLRAQALTTTQISIDTSGQGSGDAAVGFNLPGSGTITPFGNVTVLITSPPAQGTSVQFMFTFTFPGGDTLVATSTGQFGFRDISGSASISGGTEQFEGATGSTASRVHC
jgi:hypothetical protein